MKEKLNNRCKDNRLEEINRSGNGNIIDSLNSVDFVEIFENGGVALEVYEGFFCRNMQFNPFVGFLNNMVAKCDPFRKQRENWLQRLSKKVNINVYRGKIRKDTDDQYKCATKKWMKEIYDDRVKNWWPMKYGDSIVKLEDDAVLTIKIWQNQSIKCFVI